MRLRLSSHLHLGGPRKRSQHLTWQPVTASFLCDLCDGVVFTTGELTAAIIESAQLWDEGLKANLVGLSREEQDEMTRLFLSGALNRDRLAAARERDYQLEAGRRRPAVEARRLRLQQWMLNRYAETGSVDGVIQETAALPRSNAELWAQFADRTFAASTLRRNYWNRIPAQRRHAALAAFKRARKDGKV